MDSLNNGHLADCPPIPILSGQYRFECFSPELSRLNLSQDNECPAIGLVETGGCDLQDYAARC